MDRNVENVFTIKNMLVLFPGLVLIPRIGEFVLQIEIESIQLKKKNSKRDNFQINFSLSYHA